MQKILLTCFLALPCLFQKAIIKLKAIKERLRLPCPPIALRCIESLTYLAAGVFHVAQRSVSRGAYLSVAIFHRPQGGIFRTAYLYKKATWIGIYVLIPILLCGSISPTLRKVAQSPPEPSIHRSAVPVSPHSGDTHRGEETLSDAFTQLDNSAETSVEAIYTTDVSAIDGGPALRSAVSHLPATSKLNFGLVDPDQDMGAGEGTSCLQPAPFPVFSNQINSGREAYSRSAEAQSLVPNVSCAERSRSMRLASKNDSSDSSTSKKTDKITDALQARLHLEIPVDAAPDTLWVTYWEHFLKEHTEVTPGHRIPLVGQLGTFFEGNAGFKVYKWEPQERQQLLTFSTRNGQKHLFRYWTLGASDQVKIRIDPTSGRSYFSGPSANFFNAQYEVDRLAVQQRFNEMPLMVTGNPDRMLSDSLTAALYERSLQLPSELYNPMMFVIPGKTDHKLLDKYLTKPLKDYPLIVEVPHLTVGLEAEDAKLIRQKAYGLTLNLILSKIKLAKSKLKNEPYASQFRELVASIPIPDQESDISPELLSALYELTLLRGDLSGLPANQLLASYPTSISDQIMGLYLLDRFKRLEEDQAESVAQVLNTVELPWVRDLILDLQSRSISGSELLPTSLMDMEGNSFSLDRLEGKAVIVSFWISGCRFCVNYYQKTLKEVYDQWKTDERVAFVSVNADNNQSRWKSEVESGLYSHPEMIQLHQDAGSGILADYQISTFPQKLLIGPDQRLFLLTTSQYSPAQLSDKIAEMLALPSNPHLPKVHSK